MHSLHVYWIDLIRHGLSPGHMKVTVLLANYPIMKVNMKVTVLLANYPIMGLIELNKI